MRRVLIVGMAAVGMIGRAAQEAVVSAGLEVTDDPAQADAFLGTHEELAEMRCEDPVLLELGGLALEEITRVYARREREINICGPEPVTPRYELLDRNKTHSGSMREMRRQERGRGRKAKR